MALQPSVDGGRVQRVCPRLVRGFCSHRRARNPGEDSELAAEMEGKAPFIGSEGGGSSALAEVAFRQPWKLDGKRLTPRRAFPTISPVTVWQDRLVLLCLESAPKHQIGRLGASAPALGSKGAENNNNKKP